MNPEASSDDLVDAIELILQDEPLEITDSLRIVGATFKRGKTYLLTQVKAYSPAAKCDTWQDCDEFRIDRLNDIHPSAPGALFQAIAAVDDAELEQLRQERRQRLDGELQEIGQTVPYGDW